MSYKGIMDNWHGDEDECHGNCGLCDDCDERYYERSDEEYDACRDEEAA